MASLRLDRNLAIELMIKLGAYATGVRDLNKTLGLEHELGKIRATFRKLGREPRFTGAIPPELRSKTKTKLLSL